MLDESVLHRPVGGREIFKAQLHRLLDAADRPGNTIQILPFQADDYGSMGSAFSLLTFPEPADPGIV